MKQINSKRKNRGLRKLVLFAIPIVFIGTALAKYSSNTNQEVVFEAKSFYFESDLLNDATNPVSYIYQTGIDTISISLKNNIDDYNFSEVETEYEVKITNQDGESITDKNGSIVEKQIGSLSNTEIESKQMEFTNLPSGIYIVTATALKPYRKTMQATFTLSEKNESIEYDVSDSINSPVLYLTITSKDYAGNITINWPSGVTPDNTDSNFQDITTGYEASNRTITFNSNSEYTIQFFKSDPTTSFTKGDFSVEKGGG